MPLDSGQLFESDSFFTVSEGAQFISATAAAYLEGTGTRFYRENDFQDGIVKLFDLLSHPLVLAETTKLFQELYYLEGAVVPQDPNSIEEQEICRWLKVKLEELSIDDIFKDSLNAYITGVVGHELIWGGPRERPELLRVKAVPPALYTVTRNGLRFRKSAVNQELASGGRFKSLIFRYSTALDISPIGDGVGKTLYYVLKERANLLCSFQTFLQKGITPTLIVSAEAGVQKAVVKNICQALAAKVDWKTIAVPKGVTVTALPSDRDYKIYAYQLSENEKQIYRLISGEAVVGTASSLTGQRGASEASNLRRARAIGLGQKVLAHINTNLVQLLVDVKYGPRRIYPKFEYALPKLNELPIATIAEAIQVETQLGYKINPSFYENNYSLDIDQYGRAN
jgi:hypothetical protein